MKTAIVLGASSGVGAAIAEQLGAHYYGHTVVGFHRGNHIPKPARNVQLLKGDAGATYATARETFEKLIDVVEPGSVDVVVHSLSGASLGSALRLAPEKVDRTFNQLAHSFVWWTRWLVDGWLAPNARIIALSNPCPDFYLRGSGVIGAAKAALEAYVRILAAELGPQGYTVNGIRFSTVVTPALEKVMPTAIGRLEELHKHIVPAGRIQTCEDVADLVELLTLPQAKWINGAIIDGTGGAPMMLMDRAFHGERK